jgi:hypothetical protein
MTSWCMPFGEMAWLRGVNEAVAAQAFDTPSSYTFGGQVPGYATTPVNVYTSFADYARAFPGVGGWVAYDLEHWAKSPALEQIHPVAFMYAFGALAGGRGQQWIAAPSRDLIYAPGSDVPFKPPETINAGYLRTGLPGCAPAADVLLVQSQGAQSVPLAYAALVTAAAAQAAPGQQVWAALTTAGATAAQMVAAYQALAPTRVSGFFVNILAQDQAPIAEAFYAAVL